MCLYKCHTHTILKIAHFKASKTYKYPWPCCLCLDLAEDKRNSKRKENRRKIESRKRKKGEERKRRGRERRGEGRKERKRKEEERGERGSRTEEEAEAAGWSYIAPKYAPAPLTNQKRQVVMRSLNSAGYFKNIYSAQQLS